MTMKYGKAIVGSILAGLGSAASALTDGHISALEGVIIAIAFFTALGAIWAAPYASSGK